MFKKSDKKGKNISGKHPSLPVPGSSKDPGFTGANENDPKEPPKRSWKRCCNYIYDREKNIFCGRTFKSWFYIIIYSVMYLMFLSTYTLIFLYGSLAVIKYMDDFESIEKIELLTYSSNGVGLSATPTALNELPIIWYRNDPKDYQKYVNALETLLTKRRKREVSNFTELGPCSSSPFGYGSDPCVIIRINKQLNWSAKPLNRNMTENMNLPLQVQNYLKLKKQKLWLHCDGFHSYDKEHIGSIKYYPDPPGFDPEIFPLNKDAQSPLIAVQISNFTLGLSLFIECAVLRDEEVLDLLQNRYAL
ncbi:unnamed protein product, partial [Brenthis ino]